MAAELPHRHAALVAASQASECVPELLRFHNEGPSGWSAFGEVEIIEKLAEALLHAGRIHLDVMGDDKPIEKEYRDEVFQLTAACARFIEGWAG